MITLAVVGLAALLAVVCVPVVILAACQVALQADYETAVSDAAIREGD